MAKKVENEFLPDEVSPPRETLRELLGERGMSQTELAKRMGKTLKAVNELLSDAPDVAVTPETALQLERSLGLSAGFWLKREQAYRESRARQQEQERLEKEIGWLDSLPLAELRRRGIVTAARKGPEAVRQALSFFRVASVDGWKLFWSQAEVAYRLSDAYKSEIGHLATWLQCGEIAAGDLPCSEYSPKAFEASLPHLRELSLATVDEIVAALRSLCEETGVAVVIVPEFRKTHVCGAARWINGGRRPLIQLSLRYKTDDHFWFTLFHEACHILKHAKKPIYVDDKAPEGATIEAEANRFARNLLIPEECYRAFITDRSRFYEKDIVGFAGEIGIAPGIVAGRLQHDGFLDQRFGNRLKRRFDFRDEQVVEVEP